MIYAGVHEEMKDKISHFYSGLRTKIKDIVDYKEYNIVNCLFQLAMLTKKELQGRQPTKMKTSFTPRLASTTPSRTATPSGARSSVTPSMLLTPSATTTRATDLSKASILQGAAAAKPSSSNISTGHTSNIKCHHCQGIGHF
jgi:hypothetical protein